jgi:hypothetical protein
MGSSQSVALAPPSPSAQRFMARTSRSMRRGGVEVNHTAEPSSSVARTGGASRMARASASTQRKGAASPLKSPAGRSPIQIEAGALRSLASALGFARGGGGDAGDGGDGATVVSAHGGDAARSGNGDGDGDT